MPLKSFLCLWSLGISKNVVLFPMTVLSHEEIVYFNRLKLVTKQELSLKTESDALFNSKFRFLLHNAPFSIGVKKI